MPIVARPSRQGNAPLIPDGDRAFVRVDARSNPRGLPEGMLINAVNLRLEQSQPSPRKGCARLAENILINAEQLQVGFALAEDKVVTSLSYDFGVVTADCTGHGYVEGQVINLTGGGPQGWYGDFRVSVPDADHFTYSIPADPEGAAVDVVANGGPVIYDASGEAIHALGIFRSSFALDARQYLVAVGSSAVYLMNFDLGGVYLLPGADSEDVTADSTELTADAAAPGVPTIYLTLPAGEIVEDEDTLSLLQTADGLYLFRGRKPQGEWKWKLLEAGAVTFSAGTVTVALTAHGYLNGQRVAMIGADQAAYTVQADITVVDADHFTFEIEASFAPASPATGTIRVRRVKAPLVWAGTGVSFTRVPGGSNPAGATYGRLPATGEACELNGQVIALDGRDGVQVMNVGSPNEADPFDKSFRANLGGNDELIGVAPYTDNQLFIPGDHTLYSATIVLNEDGTAIDYAQSKLRELSRAFGCKAKDSIQVTGTAVLWLAHTGVHMLSNLESQDLALRALMEPLSGPVTPWVREINWAYAHRAKSAWHDSCYWLAVPTGTAQWPNEIFVWSALAGGWVSRDEYPFAINFLQPAQFQGQERLFAATRDGGLYLLHERNFGDQKPGGVADVVGRLEGRYLDWNSDDVKRVTRLMADVVLAARGGQFAATVRTFNPDDEALVATEINPEGTTEDEDVLRKVGRKCRYAQVVIEMLGADTRVRRAALEAALPPEPPGQTARTQK